MPEPDGTSGSQTVSLRRLQQIWDWDPGDVHAKSRALALVSASFGLSLGLVVMTVDLLAGEKYFQSLATLLQVDFGLTSLGAVAVASISVLLIVLGISALGGTLIVLSSLPRSYIGHVWRGALVVVLGVALYYLVKAGGNAS